MHIMKKLFAATICLILLSVVSYAQEGPTDKSKSQLVEASCGQCNFGLSGNGCTLAVKIGEKAYYVDGTSLDDHGDAHAKDGICSVVRKAKVEGEVVGDKFVATKFELLPLIQEKKQ